jgi:hypothetical protein
MTTDHVYFPEPNSGRCVANGDEPLCTLSADQHQPAAAAPGLSEAEIAFTNAEFCRFVQEAREQRARADKAEADLARTRTEAAELRQALEEADQALNGDDPLAGLAIASEIVLDALAASQSEQPPAAPVAPRGVACPTCGGDAFASFDVIVGRGCGHVIGATTPPVAPSAEAKVTDHFFVRRVCCERCAFWWQVESKRTYCERPYEEHAGSRPVTTPPDHQAGDEP